MASKTTKMPKPDAAAAATVPHALARGLHALPLQFMDDRLLVAVEPGHDTDAAAQGIAAHVGLMVDAQHYTGVDAEIEKRAPKEQPTDVIPASDESAVELEDLLEAVRDNDASDLHLVHGSPPMLRINGSLQPFGATHVDGEWVSAQMAAIMTGRQRAEFEEHNELDFSWAMPGRLRFRVNVYRQRGHVGAAFRAIPYQIRNLEELGLPASVGDFAKLHRGLVLVTGPTGSGKSTTLAAMIDAVNRDRKEHILTIEDPIEFLHPNRSSIVNQRELGSDTFSFGAALKHALRQDPDVILVGELRDLETIALAVTAAETGHLVFATLHTRSASSTIDRIIDVFPPAQQQQIRVQLASAIEGIVTQQLVPTADGNGRAVAAEVLVGTSAIRNLIREGKTHQLRSTMESSKNAGMLTMDDSLAQLVRRRVISRTEGAARAQDPESFERLARLGRAG